ncbi:uncharacterized protein Tco025E_06458 [Trypanosoma conorhini]|uniref:Fungal lipase-like domain-containing protein n=1 Tax=Trypanosoma conorhini TaxID=83891 RepID=A0A422P412_9TRYP|nr:uncharacterized protein Tco025E_06458 [Trypanosoma conorhini]RNF12404.1 hypothetical protein Tco025E_06458 [Trypanosoma conorhini]
MVPECATMTQPSHIQEFFYVSLQHTSRELGEGTHWAVARVRQAAMGFFLLDRFQIKRFAVWIATYHYVPLLASILAILVNCILHLFFQFVFPVLREKYHWGMYTWRDVKEIPLRHDVVWALSLVLSHICILLGIAAIGYKLAAVVTDAMIDSCLVTYNEAAQCTVGFHRLLQGYQSLIALPYARLFALVLVCCAFCFIIGIFNSDSLIHWERQGNDIFFLFLATMSLLAGAFIWSYYRSVDDPLGPAMTRWWRKAVPRVRRSYLYVLALYCAYLSWVKGYNRGFARFCEGMLYVSTLHVVLLLSSRLTMFFYHLAIFTAAAARVPRRRNGLVCYALLLSPLVASSVVFLSPALLLVRVLCVCGILSLVVRRWRRLDDDGRPQEGAPGQCGAAAQPRASTTPKHEAGGGATARRAARHRPGVLLRAFHRLSLTSAVALVLGLAVWVSVKHPGFEGTTPTRCDGDGTGERIRVTARYMVADIRSQAPRARPGKSVAEEAEAKHDVARYSALCSHLWADSLHAADLAYFSLMSYLQRDSTDFRAMLDFYRRFRDGGSDWVAVPTNHTYGRAVFRHIYSPSKDTSVIAVRGTDITSPFDFLQNLLLFSEIGVFKLFASFLPLSGLIPESVISDYVAASSAISSILLGGTTSDYYHLHVEEYLRTVTSRHIILTGHSLGGVVAQIVAARRRLPGVAFSSPGVNLMRKKLQIDSDAIDGFTTNVIVSNDFTVDIDAPGGTVHHIQCEHQTAEVCHSIELHAIRMWAVCPSYRSRTALNVTYTLTG